MAANPKRADGQPTKPAIGGGDSSERPSLRALYREFQAAKRLDEHGRTEWDEALTRLGRGPVGDRPTRSGKLNRR